MASERSIEVGDKVAEVAGPAGRGLPPSLRTAGADRLGSTVQVIASAVVIRGEPKQLTPRYEQRSLAGEVLDLASQPAVIGCRQAGRLGSELDNYTLSVRMRRENGL